MTAKIPCYIEFSDTGNFCRIVHQSGMIIAELIITDTNFAMRAQAAYDKFGLKKGIPERFREPQNCYSGEVNEIIQPDQIDEEIEALQEMVEHNIHLMKIYGNEGINE